MDPHRPPGLSEWQQYGPASLPPPPAPAPPAAPRYGRHDDMDVEGRNGFSVASLVLGILPITGGVLAIIFGLIGRSQAKQRRQKGRVMGTWGAALGAVWLTIIIVAVVQEIRDDARRGDNAVTALRVGDCLRSVPDDSARVDEVNLVTCTRSHKGEVYANVRLDYSSYPGEKVVSSRAERTCVDAFGPFVGTEYDDSSLDAVFIYPTARSWRLGDRKVTCVISGTDLVGSAKGTHR